VPFQNDYFRRLLEEIEETAEEKTAEQRRGDEADSVERIDRSLAEHHRPNPERLRLTMDAPLLEARNLGDRLDELYEVRTDLCRRLEGSGLDAEIVIALMRNVLVGTERMIRENREPSAPATLLAEILRQERIARTLTPAQVAETWRVLFELEVERDHYALAEDYLFHAVRLADDPEPLIHRGLDFYGHILEKSDERLERCGLPRDEAEDARWELLRRLNP